MTAVALREPETSQAKLPTVGTGFFDLHSFELTQRVARGFAASSLVPKIYQGNTPEALGNCMIAINLAKRMNADPLMVMQNLNIIQGRPSWGSPFLIATVNTCGRFTALRFEFFGERGTDGFGCRASAMEKATGEMLVGTDITIGLAKAEGWYGRNGSKWRTMEQQMLIYRAGAFWTRAYAPELSMGLMTADEAEDIIDLEPNAYREVTPKGRAKSRVAAPANDVTTIENDEPPVEDPEAEPRIDNAQAAALLTLATDAGADIGKVCKWAGVAAFNEILASDFERVRKALEAKLREARAATEDTPVPPETPADPPATGAPASPVAPASDDAGEGGEPENRSPEEDARRAGRKACRDGQSMESIPAKIARYTRHKAAWEEGYQAEGELMEAEMNRDGIDEAFEAEKQRNLGRLKAQTRID
jgi:hypothetical protein